MAHLLTEAIEGLSDSYRRVAGGDGNGEEGKIKKKGAPFASPINFQQRWRWANALPTRPT
ncbi:MAG: hypothetical protein GXY64_07915 [Bacteroidales bacterium]|nr:hypothetical protein [Bacteroidales bacterium]